jgi:23S rRNA-intervening sequence protein
MAFAFEKLFVYQKAVDFADQVCDLTEHFPARYNHLADQINRASFSVASNLVRGQRPFYQVRSGLVSLNQQQCRLQVAEAICLANRETART